MYRLITPSILSIVMFLVSCSPSRFVRPLEEKQWQVGATLGGPLIHFGGMVIPVPYTSLYAGYGLKRQLTAFASVHTTAAAAGVIQSDLGVTWGIRKPQGWKPGVSLSPVINLGADVWEGKFRAWPQLDVNAYWEYGQKKHYAYAGVSNWFEWNNHRAHGEDQPHHYIPSFQAGNTLCKNQWTFTTEVKFLAPFVSNRNVVVDYVKPGGHGAIGIYLGVTRNLGLCKKKGETK